MIAFETLLMHPKSLDNLNLYEAVSREEVDLVKTILLHPNTKVDFWSFQETMLRTKNLKIVDLICSHSSSADLIINYYNKNINNPDQLNKMQPYLYQIISRHCCTD